MLKCISPDIGGSAARRTMAVLLALGLCGGCGRAPRRTVQGTEPANAPPATIHIDRSDNGAAPAAATEHATASVRRRLLFEASGAAGVPASLSPDGLAAARQSALLEAFRRALVAWHRDEGGDGQNFEAQFSPRLRVRHAVANGVAELFIHLSVRGSDSTIVLRDAALVHEPVEGRMLERLFAETGGRFSPVPAADGEPPGMMVARVGCYAVEGGGALATASAVNETGEGDHATP